MMILRGWKAIALYLKVCEKTAKVWAQKHELPIIQGKGKFKRPMTSTLLIDDWLKNNQ